MDYLFLMAFLINTHLCVSDPETRNMFSSDWWKLYWKRSPVPEKRYPKSLFSWQTLNFLNSSLSITVDNGMNYHYSINASQLKLTQDSLFCMVEYSNQVPLSPMEKNTLDIEVDGIGDGSVYLYYYCAKHCCGVHCCDMNAGLLVFAGFLCVICPCCAAIYIWDWRQKTINKRKSSRGLRELVDGDMIQFRSSKSSLDSWPARPHYNKRFGAAFSSLSSSSLGSCFNQSVCEMDNRDCL